ATCAVWWNRSWRDCRRSSQAPSQAPSVSRPSGRDPPPPVLCTEGGNIPTSSAVLPPPRSGEVASIASRRGRKAGTDSGASPDRARDKAHGIRRIRILAVEFRRGWSGGSILALMDTTEQKVPLSDAAGEMRPEGSGAGDERLVVRQAPPSAAAHH